MSFEIPEHCILLLQANKVGGINETKILTDTNACEPLCGGGKKYWQICIKANDVFVLNGTTL